MFTGYFVVDSGVGVQMSGYRRGVILFLVLSMGLPFEQVFAVGEAGTTAADTAYRSGIAASNDGNHAAALDHFRRARLAGKDSPNLTYNIGVTLYQMGRYSESRSEFERLLEVAEWRDIAHYNLGLIAGRQHRDAAATGLFRKVAEEADSARLRQLALRQLESRQLEGDAPSPVSSPEPSTVFLSLAAGRDDNVVAFPEQLQQSSAAAADSFSELLLYGERHIAGVRGDGIAVQGFGVTRHYADLDTFDSSAYGAGVSREHAIGDGTFSWGGNLSRSTVDGETISTNWQLDINWKQRIGSNHYVFRYRPEWHNAGGVYPQLEGTRHRLDMQWRRAMNDWYWRLAYRFEINDREGIETTDGNVFDYSPTRQHVDLSATWPTRSNWQLTAGVTAGHARYDGENRLRDVDGEIVTARRESDTLQFRLRGEYRINRRWQTFGEIRDERVDDTFQLYSWDRQILRIGIEFTL